VSPVGDNLRKLNTGAQLQIFPYPRVSKSFLYSNAFMAKSGAKTLTFKGMTDKQTERQTDRQKFNFLAAPAAGEIQAPLYSDIWKNFRKIFSFEVLHLYRCTDGVKFGMEVWIVAAAGRKT